MVPKWYQNFVGRILVKKGACGNATSRKKWSLAYKMPIWLQKKGQKFWLKFWPKFWVKILAEILGDFFSAIRPFPKKNLVGSLLPRRQPVVIAEIKKNVKIGLNGSPSELFGRLLYQNAQKNKIYNHVMEIWRQNP